MLRLEMGLNTYLMVFGMIVVSIWAILYGSLWFKLFIIAFWIAVNLIHIWQINRRKSNTDVIQSFSENQVTDES